MILLPTKRTLLVAAVALALGFFIGLVFPVRAYDGCTRYDPVPPNEPTGVKGCIVYGEGIASRYSGTGVARNDCVWPWTDCQPIRITSLDTGLSVVVVPTMYCDCYTRTSDERIVDLDPATVAALGLDWSRGLYRVVVEPASTPTLPDTATR